MAVAAILFDAYGTLFDLPSAVRPHATRLGDPAPAPLAKRLGERTERFLALWRQKQLEYTWTATIRGVYRPFDAVTRDALTFALERELTRKQLRDDPDLHRDLMESFSRLEPVRGVKSVLEELKARGLRLGILSNGSPDMLLKLLGARKIAAFFDVVLSADAVRAYKPDRRIYQLGADALGLPAEEIGFVSGNAWDAAGAAEFGFDTYWIYQAPDEYGLDRKVLMLEDLGGLPDALP